MPHLQAEGEAVASPAPATSPTQAARVVTWAGARSGLPREGVERAAHDGRLLLQEAAHLVLRRRPLQLLLLLAPRATLLLVGLEKTEARSGTALAET